MAFKETFQKIPQTLWNHCPVWYSIVYSLSSRVYVLCSSSFLYVHAQTCHVQYFLWENTTDFHSSYNWQWTWIWNSQIVNSKIDYQQVCKLLYKVIWLGYEDTGDKSEWIPISELIYVSDLVADFHIIYPVKPGLLSLSWLYCGTCPMPPHIF